MSTPVEVDLQQNATSRPDVDIRYGQVGLVHVRVRTTNPGAILDELTGRVAVAPHFFRRTAVCLDLSALDAVPEVADLRTVIDVIRRVGMLAVGLAGDFAGLETVASAVNLPIMSSFRPAARPVAMISAEAAPKPLPAPKAAPEPAPAPAETGLPALIHQQMVRSGQRIYARNRDLILTAGVGAGAEVMADGCVHIYGPLRGRAMAGARGDLAARMFCQEFHAELVSVAGVFRVFEKIPAELAGKPVQAWLAGEDLHCSRIGG